MRAKHAQVPTHYINSNLGLFWPMPRHRNLFFFKKHNFSASPHKQLAPVCIEAYAPMLESGTAINTEIMLPRLATCMQSPNLIRNQDSEQPWKLYASSS